MADQHRSDPARASVDRLLSEADLDAERTISWVRIVVGLILFAGGLSASFGMGSLDPEHLVLGSSVVALLSVIAFLALGTTSLVLVARRTFRPWMAFAFVAGDAAIIATSLLAEMERRDLGGNWLAAMPLVWAAPLVLSVGTLRYRPAVQLAATAFLVIGLLVVAASLGFGLVPMVEKTPAAAGDALFGLFSLPPYLMRLVMLILVGLTATLVMVRARRLLRRAVRETLHSGYLARFLPQEITPLLDEQATQPLIAGRRQPATIMFVDIRGFTALAEEMDPRLVSTLVSSFRRRVMDAAAAHGGMIDKFIGDGALLVFGVPEPREDDAARAIACARQLLASVERWNAEREFDVAIRIGIGIHSGEVYCGVIGDERRLEFTVLGDAVNVAARLEQATKQLGRSLLVSAAVVAQAGQADQWEEISSGPVRGRGRPVAVLAPRREPPA